jgi:DNA invertase Pin-like site-specific DNA recombinase
MAMETSQWRAARYASLAGAPKFASAICISWHITIDSVTDLLATVQEVEHLGVGFVSLTEALDLTTSAGRAMAGLLAIFAEFEREILRERTRARLVQARRNGNDSAGP